MRALQGAELKYVAGFEDRSVDAGRIHKGSVRAFLIDDRVSVAGFQDHCVFPGDTGVIEDQVLIRGTADRG